MFEGGLYPYWIVIFLMMTGLYVVISRDNLVKKIIGLNIFQVSVIMFYVAMGKIQGGTAPIEAEGFTVYSNPLPHVLMLTAIVVGVATTALALAIIVRIREAYGTIEEDEIRLLVDSTDLVAGPTAEIGDHVVGELSQGGVLVAMVEHLEGAEAHVAGGHAQQHGAALDLLPVHLLVAAKHHQCAGGRDTQSMHGL